MRRRRIGGSCWRSPGEKRTGSLYTLLYLKWITKKIIIIIIIIKKWITNKDLLYVVQ